MSKDISSADAGLVVVVDGSQAIRETKNIEKAIDAMASKTVASTNLMSKAFTSIRSSINKMSSGDLLKPLTVSLGLAWLAASHLGKELIETNRIYTGFIATMATVKGTVSGAESEYGYLLKTSNRLGVEVKNAIPQYAKLSAALKNVDKEGKLTRHLFEGISEAAVVLHSRGRDVTLIFEAFQQMASKGKLSLEELQRQLGNTLPGAVGLAARAMNKSEAELRQGIQKGTINVYEFLAKVANQLKKEYGGSVEYAAAQFTARMNVMRNSVFEFYKDVGNSGAMKAFTGLLNIVIEKMNDKTISEGLGRSIAYVIDMISGLVSSINAGHIRDAFGVIKIILVSTGLVFDGLAKTIGSFYPNSQKPLQEFVGFLAQWAGAISDIFRVVGLSIKGVIQTIITATRGIQAFSKDWSPKGMGTGLRQSAGNLFGIATPEADAYEAETKALFKSAEDMLAQKENTAKSIANILNGSDSTTTKIEDYRDKLRNEKPGYLLVRGARSRAGVSSDKSSNIMSDDALADMIKTFPDTVGEDSSEKSARSREENRYLSQRGSLLRDLNKVQVQYNNLAAGRAESEGENVEKIKALITEDERYSKLTQTQKNDLLSLAQQLDAVALSRKNLIDVMQYENETLSESIELQNKIRQLQDTGYISKYTARSDLEGEFGKGGKYEFASSEDKARLRTSADKRDDDQRLYDTEVYTQQIREANREMEFQSSLYDKTKEEVRVITEMHKIDLWLQQQAVGVTEEQIKRDKERAAVLRGEVLTALDKIQSQENDIGAGLKNGLTRSIDSLGTPFERFSNFAVDSIGKIGDAFSGWITTGKLDFKSLLADMLAGLAKIIFELYVMKPLLDYVKNSMGGTPTTSGGTGGFDLFGSIGSLIGGLFGFANGGVFDNGVNRFAKGSGFDKSGGVYGHKYFNMGEMGESGPEAIMPLARDSQGVLGVRMAGGSTKSDGDVSIYVNVSTDGSVSSKSKENDSRDMESLGKIIGTKVKEVILHEKRVGGLLAE